MKLAVPLLSGQWPLACGHASPIGVCADSKLQRVAIPRTGSQQAMKDLSPKAKEKERICKGFSETMLEGTDQGSTQQQGETYEVNQQGQARARTRQKLSSTCLLLSATDVF